MAKADREKTIADRMLPVSVPKFDERHYLDVNTKAGDALKSSAVGDAFDHYLRYGIDENRYSLIRREATTLASSVERFLVSESGFCLLIGWLADEGCDPPRFRLVGGEFNVELPASTVFRHARRDVEEGVKGGAYDYGFVAFGQSPSKSLLKQSLLFQVSSVAGACQAKITPELVSDKRLMDVLLQMVATVELHAGKEVTLYSFLSGAAGDLLVGLFRTHVASATAAPYIERFRSRKVSHSFVSVLFGSTEPIKLQPMLFNAEKVDFGEWIYVCNSPEDAEAVLRYARLMSDLYDVMITVIVMGDNAGFGAANNVAVEHAASDRIFIINPDVYVLPAHAARVQQVLATADLGTTLWGGLLFYSEQVLMHSGMYLERDTFVRRNSLNRLNGSAVVAPNCRLMRVEHFDKSVPFDDREWQQARKVPAISGAVMAFDKAAFEKIDGFSTRYVYGHYEDADLSLRWGNSIGTVAIHPQLRTHSPRGAGLARPRRGVQGRGDRKPAFLQRAVRRLFRTASSSAFTIAVNRSMRIVYISYLHPAVAPGGEQQLAFELFQASLRQGHDAYLIAALEQEHEPIYGKPGAPIVPSPDDDRQYFYFPQCYDFVHLSVGDWRSIQFLRELIERLKPDVIHFHHYHRIGVESIRAARLAAPNAVIGMTFHEMMAICLADGQMVKKNSRELCHLASPVACNKCFHELRPEFFILRAARLKAALAECDVFVFPSEFLAERYVDWGLAPEKCVAIANGQFNLGADFDRKRHSPSVNRFGFFGQFIDNKGVDVILEALLVLGREQRIPPEGIVIEINGGNKHYATQAYLERITRHIDELKKIQSGRIEVRERGPYSRDQLAERMGSVDWVLVPSTWWEIFGLVVSEGWMFGRPVIASSIAALKERVIPGINGLTFTVRDSRALADVMASAVGNERQWLTLNQGIEQPWSELEMLDSYVSVWEEFAGLRRAAAPPENCLIAPEPKMTITRSKDKPSKRAPKSSDVKKPSPVA